VVLIFGGLLLTAQEPKFKVGADVEIGYIDQRRAMYDYREGFTLQQGPFYSDITLKTTIFNDFHVDFGVFNSFKKSDKSLHGFRPLQTEYSTSVYYKLNNLTVGYKHLCSHPVINDPPDYKDVFYRSSYDKVYLKYSF
jgi:hypothetical protein